jgi:CRISPR-associated protein Cas5d
LVNDKDKQKQPIAETRDLGWMLYDMNFDNPADPKPLFFKVSIVNGVVMVPPINSEEVRG